MMSFCAPLLHFYQLCQVVLYGAEPVSITPRKAIEWVKNNSEPYFPPGTGFQYTDTNYHLLGLIIERCTRLSSCFAQRTQ